MMMMNEDVALHQKMIAVVYHALLWLVVMLVIVKVNEMCEGYIAQTYVTYAWAFACVWVLGDGILIAVDLDHAEHRIAELGEQLATQASTNSLILKKLDEAHALKMENRAMLVMLQQQKHCSTGASKNKNKNDEESGGGSGSSRSPQRNSNEENAGEEEENEEFCDDIEVECLLHIDRPPSSGKNKEGIFRHSKSTSDMKNMTVEKAARRRRNSCATPMQLHQFLLNSNNKKDSDNLEAPAAAAAAAAAQ